jgi:predicted ATPase with chaperone activity
MTVCLLERLMRPLIMTLGLEWWCERSLHHNNSAARLARLHAPRRTTDGCGQGSRPGDVSLAHHGIFFLNELSEFRCHVLEVLRQPVKVQHNRNAVRES